MRSLLMFSLLVVVSGCATIPNGPSVMVLPGTGKTFDEFQLDDASCRQYAYAQVGGVSGQQAAQNAAVGSAAVGTILGTAAGAAIGSAYGAVGTGAAIGAASGLVLGSAAGSGYAATSYYETQRRYDNAYIQCMYAKGNKVPLYGQIRASRNSDPNRWSSPPPSPRDYPPPPESTGE